MNQNNNPGKKQVGGDKSQKDKQLIGSKRTATQANIAQGDAAPKKLTLKEKKEKERLATA